MPFTRRTSLLLLALAAAACGEARGPATDASTVTMPQADGSTVTVAARYCITCHGDTANATNPATDAAGIQFAPPKDLTGSSSGDKVGAHQNHLRASTLRGEGVPCSSCHVIPANAAQHTPGVNFGGLAKTAWAGEPAISPAFASGTCSATYCHGNFRGGVGQGSTAGADVAWTGGAPTCGTSCHLTPPANAVHAGKAFPASCASCHAGTVDTNGVINAAGGLHINGVVDGGGCTGCHGTDGRPNGGIAGVSYDSNQPASPPLDTNGSSTGVFVGVHLAHVNPTPSVAGATQPTGGVYKPIACTECHPYDASHPNGTLSVTFSAATGAKLTGFNASETPSAGATAATCSTYCHNGAGDASATQWSWTGPSATCSSCHGFPPASAVHASVASNATACNGCHSGTVKTDGTIDIVGGLHINGVVDAAESTGGAACGGCHSAIFTAMTSAATSRHALTLDTPADDATSWASPLSNVPTASRSCVNMCHADHPHDLTTPVVSTHEYNVYVDASTQATRAAATRTSATRAKTDFSATGSGGLCVSCHDAPISTGGPTISATAFGASAHDFTSFTSGTTWTWQYALHSGTFDRNCTKCHASATEGTTPTAPATGSSTTAVHSNTNPSLLAGTATPIAAGLVCFNCHGSAAAANGSQGDRSGVDIQSEFAKTGSNHAVAGVDCMSCHDPHKAKAGDHATPGNFAGPPIEGAAGAALASANYPAFWTAPAAGAFSATTIVAGTDLEATLCFKCHTAFAGTLPAGTTDVAKEFNPNNVGNFAGTWAAGETAGGFHPVLASAGANLGAVKLTNLVTTNHAWNNTTGAARNTMTCTDCHGSDGITDPNGPHGSAANFILKGPNTTWSASVVLNGSTLPAGTFCLNCHQNTFTNSRFTGHSNGNHSNVPCFNCHAAVPHGGPRPGMLVAGAGASANVGGSIAGWDTASPYWQGTGTDRLYIASYPTTNGGNWSQGNCGCNGTGH